MKRTTVRAANDILRDLARSADPTDAGWARIDCAAELAIGAWAGAVGVHLARRSRPSSLNGRLLIVDVDEPEWIPELRAIEDTIRDRLNRAAGRSVVGRVLYRETPARRRGPGRAVAPEGDRV